MAIIMLKKVGLIIIVQWNVKYPSGNTGNRIGKMIH